MRIVFFLLLILLSVNGWSACTSYTSTTQFQCSGGGTSCSGCPVSGVTMTASASGSFGPNCSSPGSGTVTLSCSGTPKFGYVVSAEYARPCSGNNYGAWGIFKYKVCDTECEAASLGCYPPSVFDPVNCRCVDNSPCDTYRAQCEQAKGVFSGSANNGCCIATCDQCGALKDAVSQKAQMCCNQGMAPPDQARQCRVEARNTCGMNWSTFLSKDNEFSCQSPSVSAEASQRYADQCFDNSSSSTANSSSSGGGSSGGDCPECPILEDILATLTDQKGTVEAIYRCLSFPDMCDLGGDSLPPWVREKMDVMIDQDSITANNTTSIDSAVRAIGDNQKRSDSATRDVIREGVDSIVAAIASGGDSTLRRAVEGGFSTLDSTTDALNDSTRKWLRFIADSLDVGTDSIVAHIDSIVSRLPDSILDSILKYQKYATDNFDSAFWGVGNGFQKIDDLTDSAIKYFKQGFHYDSVYTSLYCDSLGEIHEAINSLTSIGYALGYGDTATNTLRGDLSDLRGAIASFDSSVSGEIDSLLKLLSPGSIDSAGLGAEWGGIVARGERKGDSIVNSLGWGGIDTLDIDSLYARALSGYKSDSISQSVLDSLNELGGRLNDSLVAKNDSIKNALPGVLDSMADSLVLWAPFADFDSIIYSSIGAHIPNRADCPEDCQKWTVSIPIIGLHSYTVDFGLCLGRASFAGMSVLGFLKLLIRIIVAYTCIMTVGKVLVRMV